jgi:hypothetical protein
MVRGQAHTPTGLRHRSENTSLHLLELLAARLCLIISAHLDFTFSAPRPRQDPGGVFVEAATFTTGRQSRNTAWFKLTPAPLPNVGAKEPASSGRQFLEHPSLRFECEQQGDDSAGQGYRRECCEDVLDPQVSNDRSD